MRTSKNHHSSTLLRVSICFVLSRSVNHCFPHISRQKIHYETLEFALNVQTRFELSKYIIIIIDNNFKSTNQPSKRHYHTMSSLDFILNTMALIVRKVL